MSKTKILIILGAVAGLILVVGLAVGLTQRPKPTKVENDSLGADEITSVRDNSAEPRVFGKWLNIKETFVGG